MKIVQLVTYMSHDYTEIVIQYSTLNLTSTNVVR